MRWDPERALVGDGSLRGGKRRDHQQVSRGRIPRRLRRPVSFGRAGCSAVVSARELLEIVAKLKRSSSRFADLDIGLAVHYGNVLSGLVGAANRREFTVIGDVVNLAFRMEQANKEIGSRLVVTAEAAQAAGIRDSFPVSELPVRRRNHPVRLCRLA